MAALAAPAMAQVASSSGTRVVVDPETRRARVVNTLDGLDAYTYRPPPTVLEPIILKKPKRHKPKPPPPQVAETPVEAAPAAEPSPSEESSSPASSPQPTLGADDYVSPFGPTPEPAPKPTPKRVAEKPKPAPKAEPAPPPASNETIPFSLSGQDDYGPAPAKPQQQATAAPAPSSAKPPSDTGKVRNIHINFPPGTAEPSADVAAALQSLAGDITNELQTKSARLLLQAFAGTPGDKSSEARRLSLKRALAVRQLLIDSGVPSDKIDVRAMGGITDGGKPDRVDVMLRG
jgi:outer membrane protein OmpA-like peptidoglycan-associated protein